jgi:zinc protease
MGQMKNIVIRFTLALLACLALTLSGAQAFDIPFTQTTLTNGLQLVVIEDHRSPIVFHAIGYKVGAADQPPGKTGLAHFFEHLLFKATKNRPNGEFDRLMDENGAQKNAFTTQDVTVFWERAGKDLLPTLMDIEADRMQNLVLTDDVVATELKVVQEERRQRTESEPSAILYEQMDAALYTIHPYGRPVVGVADDVAKLTRADAEAFYRAHYTPKNAIVLVVGDVNPKDVQAMAEKYYGPLLNTAQTSDAPHPVEPAGKEPRNVTFSDVRVSSPTWMRKYLAPSYGATTERQAAALDLMGVILGGTSQSRLSQTLVFGEKSATTAGAGYNGDQRDSGYFQIFVQPAKGIAIDQIAKSTDRLIADLATNGPTQAELDEARQQAVADYVYALDEPVSFGRMVGIGLADGVPKDRILNRDKAYAMVTVDDLKQAAHDVLRIENSVTGTLLPAVAQ